MEYANYENKTTMVFNVTSAFADIINKESPMQMSPLVLAYIGDTVYDLYVRTMLVKSTTLSAHGLHMRAAKLVCAKAQAEAFRKVESMLSEDELAVFRRGRNAHMGTVPKNAQIIDYRHATGFEAVVGYLYLLGKDERLSELMEIVFKDVK